MKEISVVIPTFNGIKLLEEYLPYLKTALDSYPCDSEVIIVENGSSDDSVLFLSRTYPEVRILKNRVNEGFGPAVNRGVREAKYGIVLLLNNDIRVEKDFIKPLVRHFDDPSVFAVVCKSLVNLTDRVINESVTVPGFSEGLLLSHQPFVHDKNKEDIKNPCTNFYASGGFGVFDRKKFLELGGFDDIYHPFYYEDIDLSYQAWKRGWQVLYEPNSVVHHRSHATSRKVASDDYINRIEERNRFLLTWKNISDPDFIYQHIKWLSAVFIRSFSRGSARERYFLRCLLMALPRLHQVIRYRIKNSRHIKLSDKRVFALAANVETSNLKFNRFVDANHFTPDKGPKILLIDPQGYQ
ncbi:MAG TPA: hypothetical protein DHW81_04995, partial [Nitrospiraceae bacterium]|nr:hypothetical protein [Nitrospiraceae bacterium]